MDILYQYIPMLYDIIIYLYHLSIYLSIYLSTNSYTILLPSSPTDTVKKLKA